MKWNGWMNETQRPFDLNEDQKSMQDMVQGFAREKITPHVQWGGMMQGICL